MLAKAARQFVQRAFCSGHWANCPMAPCCSAASQSRSKNFSGYRTGIALRRLRSIVLLLCLALLGGCKAVVFDPSGDVALQQRTTCSLCRADVSCHPARDGVDRVFAWHYRQSNTLPATSRTGIIRPSSSSSSGASPLLIIIASAPSPGWARICSILIARSTASPPASRAALRSRSKSRSSRSIGSGCSSIRIGHRHGQ